MSQAHRPTWNPTQGRETKAGSQQISKLSLASHTKLKFRQPGQGSSSDVSRRDLRAELLAAERVAQEKKRKAAGLPPLPGLNGALRIENGNGNALDGEVEEDEETRKRRKVLEEAAELDKDDSDDDDEKTNGMNKGKSKALVNGDERSVSNGNGDGVEDVDESVPPSIQLILSMYKLISRCQ